MVWDDLTEQAANTIQSVFGTPATALFQACTIILDVRPQIIGELTGLTEPHPIAIFLRSEIDELEIGDPVSVNDDEYEIIAPANEYTDRHHLAYWVRQVSE